MTCRLRFSQAAMWSFALLLGFLAGCRGSVLNPETDLQLRFDAASKIDIPADRDQAMVSVAMDAAEQGDVRALHSALSGIKSVSLRNETASECAVRLVKAGRRYDANKLAASITDAARRDATYKRLADSEPGSTDPAAPHAAAIGY